MKLVATSEYATEFADYDDAALAGMQYETESGNDTRLVSTLSGGWIVKIQDEDGARLGYLLN